MRVKKDFVKTKPSYGAPRGARTPDAWNLSYKYAIITLHLYWKIVHTQNTPHSETVVRLIKQ